MYAQIECAFLDSYSDRDNVIDPRLGAIALGIYNGIVTQLGVTCGPLGDITPPVIDVVEVWKNGASDLSVQARITDDSGTLAAYGMSVDAGSRGQIGQTLAPFPSSDYSAHMYAGTRDVDARGPTTHRTTTNRITTNGKWHELVACGENWTLD